MAKGWSSSDDWKIIEGPPRRWEGGEREGRTLREMMLHCARARVLSISALAGRRETLGSLCPWLNMGLLVPTCRLCQGHPGLNGLLRLQITGFLIPSSAAGFGYNKYSPFLRYLFQICLLTLSLPLAPAAYSCTSLPLCGLLPSLHVPELKYPTQTEEEIQQIYKHARVHTNTHNTHTTQTHNTNTHNTNTHKCMHLFSPSPCTRPPPNLLFLSTRQTDQ